MQNDLATLAGRLRHAMELAGITNQTQLARAVGVKPQAIQYLLDPKNNASGSKHLTKIAEVLSINPLWLATGENQPQPSSFDTNVVSGPDVRGSGSYPLISWIQAGEWTGSCESFSAWQAEDWRMCPHNLGACGYVLRVRGASMTNPNGPHSFPEGMLLFINPEKDPLPGQFVIARRENEREATFKRYVVIDGDPFLEAINPDWPKRYLQMEPGDILCGVVVDASFGNLP